MFEMKCNSAQCSLSLHTELHGSQTKWPVATGWQEGRNLRSTPIPPLPVSQQGNQPMEGCRSKETGCFTGGTAVSCLLPKDSEQGICSLIGAASFLSPGPKCPTDVPMSCIFMTALPETCPPVPGTAARTPG